MRFSQALATYIPRLSEEGDDQSRKFTPVVTQLCETEAVLYRIRRHATQLSLLGPVTRNFFQPE